MVLWVRSSKGAALVVWRNTRRVVIFVIGMTVVLIGLVMVVLPGPAILVIPLGLAILATEFVWARLLLKRVKASATNAAKAVTGRDNPHLPPAGPGFKGMVCRAFHRCKLAASNAIAPFRPGYVDAEIDGN